MSDKELLKFELCRRFRDRCAESLLPERPIFGKVTELVEGQPSFEDENGIRWSIKRVLTKSGVFDSDLVSFNPEIAFQFVDELSESLCREFRKFEGRPVSKPKLNIKEDAFRWTVFGYALMVIMEKE